MKVGLVRERDIANFIRFTECAIKRYDVKYHTSYGQNTFWAVLLPALRS